MKTVVVISTRGFGAFRHDLLVEPENVQLFGIFSAPDAANITAAQREFFSRIHTVPCGVPDPTFAESSIVEINAARDIIAGLLRQTSPADLTVHCHDEQNVLVAAQLRTEFGLAGHSYSDVLPYRDKCLMKERLATTGLRVPRFGRFDPAAHAAGAAAYFGRIAADVGLPFVLKPVDAAAADGVYKIFSWQDFASLPGRLRRRYEYEEYIEGTMFSVNLVSQGQQAVFGGVTEYLVNSTEVQKGRVNADINLIGSDPRVEPMIDFAKTALAALGWLDGASHLELFLRDSGELVFLEVAARFKGLAGLAAMQENYAIALLNVALEIESGIKSHPWDKGQVYCFDGVIPKRPGIVVDLVEPVLESDYSIKWQVRVGEEIGQSRSLSDNGGTFLVRNSDYGAVRRDFERLATYEPIRYKE
jgi:biotin carboxylase